MMQALRSTITQSPMKNHPRFALIAVSLTSLVVLSSASAKDKDKNKVPQTPLTPKQQWMLWQQQNPTPVPQTSAPRRAAVPVAPQPGGVVQLQMLNRAGVPVQAIWIAPDGSQQNYGTIPNGGSVMQPSIAGHSWAFVAGGQVVKQITATAAPLQNIVINRPAVQQQQLQQVPVLGGGGAFNSNQTTASRGGNGSTGGGGVPDAQASAFLLVHNQARAAVGVPPLSWSTKLAAHAQQWANHLASLSISQVQGNPHRPNGIYGENFAGGTAGGYTPADGARQWLDEKSVYRHGPYNGSGATGHYTQMVWRGTTEVGYGVATSRDGWTYVVANYSPAGNTPGQRPY
jgi:pathogenesis-related protein 1